MIIKMIKKVKIMNKEREKLILEIMLKEKKVTVKRLSKLLYASEPSIRRDLAGLEASSLVRRVHGGAVLNENGSGETKIPFLIRELEESNEKLIIAQKAAPLVKDGDVIFLDASSSAFNMIPFIAEKKDITVITNGIKAINALCEYKDRGLKIIATGGRVHTTCLAFVGEDAFKTIEQYNADVCFFACRGLSNDGRLTDIAPDEDYVRIKMIEHSKKSYLLCTAEKIGNEYYHNICHLDKISGAVFGESPLGELEKYEVI